MTEPLPQAGGEVLLERHVPARAVADALGVSLKTLHAWESAGIIHPVRIRGRRYFAETEVRALWAKRLDIVLNQ